MSTRALSKPQIAKIRTRFQQLKDQFGSENKAARSIGISQQVFNRIMNGDPAGLYVAKKLAKFDKIPLESILDLVPTSFEHAIRGRHGHWSDPAVAAARKLACAMDPATAESHAVAYWTELLDKMEAAVGAIVKDYVKKNR